ncbi:MAG: hypothetical protein JWL58_5835 [Streptosporangiaceae bacterium]|jgi:hypothetical protein|nr:hypothetical protein [Streptosporangiaceae bacterium]
MFHFLTDPADRATYLQTLRAALADGGGITAGMVRIAGSAERLVADADNSSTVSAVDDVTGN